MIDPTIDMPTPANYITQYPAAPQPYTGSVGAGRWKLYLGSWSTAAPRALFENPAHWWPGTGGGYQALYEQQAQVPWTGSATYSYSDETIASPESIASGGSNSGGTFRSLHDNNAHNPPQVTSPHWQLMVPAIGNTYTFGTPPGVSNLRGSLAGPYLAWFGSPIEASVQCRPDQWAKAECQDDYIGPVVRATPTTDTWYGVYTTYNDARIFNYNNPNAGYGYPIDLPASCDDYTAQMTTVTLYRMNSGSMTVLKQWQVFGAWGQMLSVAGGWDGTPVALTVQSRFWGYDPFDQVLDTAPWRFLGTVLDTSSLALTGGQPGYLSTLPHAPFVFPAAPLNGNGGMYWWGWGDYGAGPYAAPDLYIAPAGAASPTVFTSTGTDVAYASPSLQPVSMFNTAVGGVMQLTPGTASAAIYTTGGTAVAGSMQLTAAPGVSSQAGVAETAVAGIMQLTPGQISGLVASQRLTLAFNVWSGVAFQSASLLVYNGSGYS
jgi:hypothetical protein